MYNNKIKKSLAYLLLIITTVITSVSLGTVPSDFKPGKAACSDRPLGALGGIKNLEDCAKRCRDISLCKSISYWQTTDPVQLNCEFYGPSTEDCSSFKPKGSKWNGYDYVARISEYGKDETVPTDFRLGKAACTDGTLGIIGSSKSLEACANECRNISLCKSISYWRTTALATINCRFHTPLTKDCTNVEPESSEWKGYDYIPYELKPPMTTNFSCPSADQVLVSLRHNATSKYMRNDNGILKQFTGNIKKMTNIEQKETTFCVQLIKDNDYNLWALDSSNEWKQYTTDNSFNDSGVPQTIAPNGNIDNITPYELQPPMTTELTCPSSEQILVSIRHKNTKNLMQQRNWGLEQFMGDTRQMDNMDKKDATFCVELTNGNNYNVWASHYYTSEWKQYKDTNRFDRSDVTQTLAIDGNIADITPLRQN